LRPWPLETLYIRFQSPFSRAEVNDTAKAIENIRGNALEIIAEI